MVSSSTANGTEGAGRLSRLESKWEAHLDRVNVTVDGSRFWRLWTKRLGRRSITVGDVAVFSGYAGSFVGAVAICVAVGSTQSTSLLAKGAGGVAVVAAWLPSGYFFAVTLDRNRSRLARTQEPCKGDIENLHEGESDG